MPLAMPSHIAGRRISSRNVTGIIGVDEAMGAARVSDSS
jgi:hypothetical protein